MSDKMILFYVLLIFVLVIYYFERRRTEKYSIGKNGNSNGYIKMKNNGTDNDAILKDIGDYKKYLNYTTPKILDDTYNDISLFLYSIQHLYIIDTKNFEEIVRSLDYFIMIYESLIEDKNDINGYKFLLLLNTRNKIITELNLFTFSERFENMSQVGVYVNNVNKILSKYINEIKSYYDKNISENGYNVFTKIIFDPSDPAPYNILSANYDENKN